MRACSRAALVALAAFAAAPTLADWKDDYARGLEAVRDGRWGEAARYMDSALAGNAQPAQRLRLYGQRYEVYAPQHYAGLAALRQGNCAAAMRFWDQGGNRSIVAANAPLAAVEQRGRADCTSALASEAKPAAPPATTATPARPDSPPATVPQRPLVQTPPPSVPPARTPPPVAKPAVDVEQRPRASAAAESLRPALEAYLAGRYADVLRLGARPAGDPRVGWHLQILRAAAAYQLAELGSGPDDAATIAREAANEARRLDAARRPDATFYSPKFVAFYGSQ